MDFLPGLLPLSAAVLVLIGLGWSIGYSLAAKSRDSRIGALEQDARQSQGELQRSMRVLEKMKAENKTLANIMIFMPEIARAINTNQDPDKVAPLVLNAVEQLFSPRQIALFYANDPSGSKMTLIKSKGLLDPSRVAQTIMKGQGRIGAVASDQVTRDLNDFTVEARSRGTSVQDDPPGYKLELYSPMIHDDEIMGVLALGGPEARHPEEKKMLRMIADLGSSALFNARRIVQIKHSADQDGLTSLLNKKAFMIRLGIEIDRCERQRAPLVVFIFDIDHFKHYNDTNGHQGGDEVLRGVGKLLREESRKGDIVARYGGEEFIIAMPNTDAEGGLAAAEKIRAAIEQFHFPNQEEQPNGNLTISGGIAVFPVDGRSTGDLISHADQALYECKKGGRNRVKAFQARTIGMSPEPAARKEPAE
jgi:diguanylate cyclase (GGDEF)-like protein